jgi:hypothetical protein
VPMEESESVSEWVSGSGRSSLRRCLFRCSAFPRENKLRNEPMRTARRFGVTRRFRVWGCEFRVLRNLCNLRTPSPRPLPSDGRGGSIRDLCNSSLQLLRNGPNSKPQTPNSKPPKANPTGSDLWNCAPSRLADGAAHRPPPSPPPCAIKLNQS